MADLMGFRETVYMLIKPKKLFFFSGWFESFPVQHVRIGQGQHWSVRTVTISTTTTSQRQQRRRQHQTLPIQQVQADKPMKD